MRTPAWFREVRCFVQDHMAQWQSWDFSLLTMPAQEETRQLEYKFNVGMFVAS